ncbi:MAG: NifB/NifX family molybdenum-iron cluster-binding protein [Synergistaceae bacterium]|nr:NifB/NifX family molybdenum-iron cluster-binding protein [Synergistaceae bacterium]
MRVAVTYENGNIFQHFGKTENFKLYDIENKSITRNEVISTNGQAHGILAGFLKAQGVDVLICGGIGSGAQEALNTVGIKFFAGVNGSADEAVKKFLDGRLEFDSNPKCDNHTCKE